MIYEKRPFLKTLVKTLLKGITKRTSSESFVIVDVGAFDGTSCLGLAGEFEESTIYALEPCPITFRTLLKRTKNCSRIWPRRIALSDHDGEADLFLEDCNHLSQSHSLYEDFVNKKNIKQPKKIRAQVRTLKTFCEDEKIEHIHFLNMNCEGGEYKIFEDETSLEVFDEVDILSVALHGKHQPFTSYEYILRKKNINRFLKEKGFCLVLGEDINSMKDIPSKHIQQVWIKKRLLR
jgi:FkbM family methyltransferase